MKLLSTLAVGLAAVQSAAGLFMGKPRDVIYASDQKRELLQDLVTWDEHSLFVKGERIFLFSGEFHPFRLPVPSLWIDVFQKVKALGFNAVSFYVHWALLEGKHYDFTAEGVFAWEPFFEAAQEAGIYLIARPGPYINAEASGGGFPGWLQRVEGLLRTSAPDYLQATDNYQANIGAIIAKAQITEGGPIILYQPENEYSGATDNTLFPDPAYMQYVEDQARNASIVVPLISNDAWAAGHNAPGTGEGEVDIYGHDGYPLGFDCANPYTWPSGDLPTYYRATHLVDSPSTPYSLDEFQGGSFDPWGGLGFDQCSLLLNMEFERVFYKNNYAAGVAILNLYMIFGGTNWGNLGHPGGYTSYDYGSVIAENLTITREKYTELKLQAQFLKVSPAYITATAYYADNVTYTNDTALTVTPVIGNGTATNFYIIRHTAYESLDSTPYKLYVSTSAGDLTLPQLGGALTLNGRDSKVHLTDYDVSGTTLLYSTAEVYTWKKFSNSTVLILYGGPNELHELAIKTSSKAKVLEGPSLTSQSTNGTLILNWEVSPTRRIVQVGSLTVYLLDRNSAYEYWVPDLPAGGDYSAYGTSHFNPKSVIVKAGYLVRSVATSGNTLEIVADFNATTPIEIIGAPKNTSQLTINGKSFPHVVDSHGVWKSSYNYTAPSISIPDLTSLTWKYLDALPEVQSNYDDSLWTPADKQSLNSLQPQLTPTSLFGSDYGYNTGYLLFRGYFTATGSESTLSLHTEGGSAYGHSIFLNSTYVGSWVGIDATNNYTGSYTLPNLTQGATYVLTVIVDNNGLDEDWTVGTDEMKDPRGILEYSFGGVANTSVTWKLTGNLGGEDYVDRTRGPLNEGGSYPERNGYHLPNPPSEDWAEGSPYTGLSGAGIGFFTTSFDLDLPSGWEVPLSFLFTNSTTPPPDYRVQLFVNGWQFGKYTNNIGPQTRFFVPEGILNYNGQNTLSLTYWLQQDDPAGLDDLKIISGTPVWTGRPEVTLVDSPAWSLREGAY